MNVLKHYGKASFLLWLVGVKFCIFSINAFTVVVYTEPSVGYTLTWSLYKIFTIYLSFAISLSKSMRGFIFLHLTRKLVVAFGSVLCLASFSTFSSESVLNLFVVVIVPPSY
jgi:hypothetical protein